MPEPRIQYAKTRDGVSIAYWTMGEGDPPLIMSPQLGWSHISLELRVPELARWYEHLASRRMVVRYDPRCQGLSDREVEQIGEAELTSDVEAVIERLSRPQLDLLGGYGLGPPMVRVAAKHPNEVRRLVLCNPFLMGHRRYGNERARAVRNLIDSDWDLFTRTFAQDSAGWSTRFAQQATEWSAYIRRAVSPRDAALILDALASIDWRPWLAEVRVPTLVLNPSDEARWSDIADVRVQIIDLQGHVLLHQSEAARAAIDAFLAEGEERAGEPPLGQGTAVILFLDIADSTALTTQLGDAAYRERERALDSKLRAAITDVGGSTVEGKVLGDGVMAVFSSARQAIDAARRCRVLGSEEGLPLHLGIHAGDVEREGANVHGGAVQVAARVQGQAAADEILVSQTVRDLARTSAGVQFEDRGEHELKGIVEPVRLFVVREPE